MTRATDMSGELQGALRAVLAEGLLPHSKKERAERLLEEFVKPVRVSILGWPGMEKTQVLNFLAGNTVLPRRGMFNTIRLKHSDTPKLDLVLADGTMQSFEGDFDLEAAAKSAPPMAEMGLDLKALGKITLLKSQLPDDKTDQVRAMAWAAKQTDIAIWCTEVFSGPEQAAWDRMPDRIKDHAILLRVRGEELGEDRDEPVSQLARAFSDEFAHFTHLSVAEAGNARACVPVDKKLFQASGGMRLISLIRQDIERAQRHVADQAELLLLEAKQAGSKAATAKPADTSQASAPAETGTVKTATVKVSAQQAAPRVEATAPQAVKPVATAKTAEPEAPKAEAVTPKTQEPEPAPKATQAVEPAPTPKVEAQPPAPKPTEPQQPTAKPAAPVDVFAPDFFDPLQPDPASFFAEPSVAKREPSDVEFDDEEAPLPNPASFFASPPVAAAPKAAENAGGEADVATAGPEGATQSAADVPQRDAAYLETMQRAYAILSETGASLYDASNDATPNDVLARAFEAVQAVSDDLEQSSVPTGHQDARFRKMTEDATDLIQLLCIEADADSALDAVTALVQLKREAQRALAA